MSDKKFSHRVVYVDRETIEAKRCEDCGAAPVIEWDSWYVDSGLVRYYAKEITCPNGPHEISTIEHENIRRRRLQDLADRKANEAQADTPRRRWWWR